MKGTMYKEQKLKKCPKCGYPAGLIKCPVCHVGVAAEEVGLGQDWRVFTAEPNLPVLHNWPKEWQPKEKQVPQWGPSGYRGDDEGNS